jgi:hypothetical protein
MVPPLGYTLCFAQAKNNYFEIRYFTLIDVRLFFIHVKRLHMKNAHKFVCSLLVSSMMFLPFATHARLVSTEEASASSNHMTSLDKVNSFIRRTDVIAKFEQLGLSTASAKERVAAMTQQEIDLIASKVDSLPTGGYITSTGGVIIGVTLIIVIALITHAPK